MQTDRRTFVKTSLLTAGTLAFAGSKRGEAAQQKNRFRKGRFKLSCAAYSYRKYLKKGDMTLDDFIDRCVELDIDAVELTSYYFPEKITSAFLNHLKNKTFRYGLDISGTAIRNDFCKPAGEDLDREIAHVKKWIDYSAEFSAPCIRIFAGKVPKGVSEAQAIDWCVHGIKRCLDYAGRRGVFLALENHHGIVARATNLKMICDRVGAHPWFGVNLDTGNFFTDPYGDMEIIAPYVITVQAKDYVMAEDGKTKVEPDFNRILNILDNVGYRGYIALEYEGKKDPVSGVPEWINKLKQAIYHSS